MSYLRNVKTERLLVDGFWAASAMSVSVQVTLLSGQSASIYLQSSSPVGDLRKKAQHELRACIGKMINASGVLLDDSASLVQAGVADGDAVTALAQDVRVAATEGAFACIRADGSVVAWGRPDKGGRSGEIQDQLHHVEHIQASSGAFAAIRADRTVVTWGAEHGGDSSSVQHQLTDVVQIQSTHSALAAIKSDGSVITWGRPESGGDGSEVSGQLYSVTAVQGNLCAFAALRTDGGVVTWGDVQAGGYSGNISSLLQDVVCIQRSRLCFAAIKRGGEVVCWGDPDGRESGFWKVLRTGISDVAQFQISGISWAAISKEGRMTTGLLVPDAGVIGETVASPPEVSDVRCIYSLPGTPVPEGDVFVAVCRDGAVVSWGDALSGGDSRAVQSQLKDVVSIQASCDALAALAETVRS